jgi:signal transduction histidine kinase
VTITDADRETFQTTVEEFRPQITEDMCLPTALKNVLDEFAERHGFDSPLSLSDLNDICDYRDGGASTSRNVPAKLDPEIEEYGIETRIMFNTTFEDLEAIIDDNDRSLPIVELDAAYFDSVEGHSSLAKTHTSVVWR